MFPWLFGQVQFLRDLGGCFLDGFSGRRDDRNMIFLEYLFGLLNFIFAGGKLGIVTVWITLFPNVVQKVRGSGEAYCAFHVAEDAIRQPVFGKELIGKGEVGRFQAHLGSHVD